MPSRLPRRARAVILCACAALALPLLTACSKGDDASAGNSGGTTAASTNDSAPSPSLALPVSRFAVSQADLGNAFLVDCSRSVERQSG